MNNKNWIKFRGIVWAIVAVLLSIFLIINISTMRWGNFNINIFPWTSYSSSRNLKTINEYEFDNIDDIKNINSKVRVGDFIIESSKDNTIKVIVKSNKKQKNKEIIKATESADTLLIEDKSSINFTIGNNTYFEVIVYLPESYNGNININNKTGDVKLTSNLDISNLNIDISTGDVSIKNTLFAKKVSIESHVGDISINNLDTDDLYLKSKLGDVTIKNFSGKGYIDTKTGDIECGVKSLIGDFDISTKIGDVDLSVDENLVFYFNVNKNVGDISCDLEFNNVSQSTSSFRGERGKTPSNEITIDIKTGDMSIDYK